MVELDVMWRAMCRPRGAAAPVQETSHDFQVIPRHSRSRTAVRRLPGKCHRAGVAVSIAIVDDAGQLVQFGRMDGARAYTVDLAMRKARTAAAVGVATRIITEMSRNTAGPVSEAAVGSGGLPVLAGGATIGAIGISGAKPEIDEAIAAAGVAAIA
jgi:glc operon protein GlcG